MTCGRPALLGSRIMGACSPGAWLVSMGGHRQGTGCAPGAARSAGRWFTVVYLALAFMARMDLTRRMHATSEAYRTVLTICGR